MKKLLIISPLFPPVNAADMQRVRMSLPYFKGFGWQAEVVKVDEQYINMPTDLLLNESIPADIKIHSVKAFNTSWTSKLGLGSVALRSLWFYRKRVNQLLKTQKFDLIYFSTTQFPVCVLGAYWKKRFGVPYVIDMQDPWHSEYYKDKPKEQRPPKYWFSYRLNKYTEPIAIKQADGLISVSEAYISDLKERYSSIENIPAATITFGAFPPDMEIAARYKQAFAQLLSPQTRNIVYIGRGGADMQKAIRPLFKVYKQLLTQNPEIYKQLHFYFIGTSYAPKDRAKETVMPLAHELEIADNVSEQTGRISYFHTLLTLQQADALFMPGSDDPKYTASKIYPYLLTNKPLLAVFHPQSPAMAVLKECGVDSAYNPGSDTIESGIANFLASVANGTIPALQYNQQGLDKHMAVNMTKHQCGLFEKALAYNR